VGVLLYPGKMLYFCWVRWMQLMLCRQAAVVCTLNHRQIKLHIFGGSCYKISTPKVHESIMGA